MPALASRHCPLLFFDGSTSFHGPPLGVGGSVLPLEIVVSAPPFAGRYWPDFGAGLPGFVALDFGTYLTSCPSTEHPNRRQSLAAEESLLLQSNFSHKAKDLASALPSTRRVFRASGKTLAHEDRRHKSVWRWMPTPV